MPSSFSYRVIKPVPAEGRHSPLGFLKKTFFAACSADGISTLFLDGMYTIMSLRLFRLCGGRYIALPLYFSLEMTLWTAEREEMTVESRSSPLTNLAGLMNSRRAPQKVKPKPVKARIGEVKMIEEMRAVAPSKRSK